MRHLSYVRTEEDVMRKMATFSHAGEEQVGDIEPDEWHHQTHIGNCNILDVNPPAEVFFCGKEISGIAVVTDQVLDFPVANAHQLRSTVSDPAFTFYCVSRVGR